LANLILSSLYQSLSSSPLSRDVMSSFAFSYFIINLSFTHLFKTYNILVPQILSTDTDWFVLGFSFSLFFVIFYSGHVRQTKTAIRQFLAYIVHYRIVCGQHATQNINMTASGNVTYLFDGL